jgi:pyruvate/2-oxoacid:ferredoxin oxidoreductase beta subunit
MAVVSLRSDAIEGFGNLFEDRGHVLIDSLDREIQNLAGLPEESLPKVTPLPLRLSEPMPNYVEHADGVSHVGSLSAEAVVRHYEEAAKAIEAMGTELMDVAMRCEQHHKKVMDAIKDVERTAAFYREEAKKAFEEIEKNSIMVEDVRKTCTEIRNRIGRGGEG